MRLRRVGRWLGLVLVLFALAWSWIVVTTIPPGWEGEPGPRGFPLLLGVALGALGLYLGTSALFSRAGPDDEERIEPVSRSEVRTVGLTIGIFVAYAFLLDKLGFLLATPVAVVLALRLVAGQRSWPGVLLVAVGLTIGSYLVFGVLMAAHLPDGSWLQLLQG